MMNGYNGWDGNGWEGAVPYGHPGIASGDVAAFLIPMVFFMLALALALVAFQIWLYYRIFAKAGYNGWWSLLALIPGVGTLVVMLVLAFDNWPIHRGEVGGSPMTPSTHAVQPINVAAQATAYNPAQTTAYSPAQAPVAASAPAPVVTVPVAPAEPPVPAAPMPVEPVPASPYTEESPKAGSAE